MDIAELHIPFTWKDRQPFFKDKFIYIPWDTDLSNYSFPSLQTLFTNKNPVVIEYCSGNGTWIIERAQKNPTINFLAIEKKFDRAETIWRRAKKNKLQNLISVWTEGYVFTKNCLPSACVEKVYVNFPDPWPKRRHRKNRILNSQFFIEIHRILASQGNFIFVTDDADYSESFIKEMKKCLLFMNLISGSGYGILPQDYGTSFFQEFFEKKGKVIRYHEFVKL